MGLRDPRVRLVLGAAAFALTGLAVEPDRVGPLEEGVFQVVNRLPDGLAGPVWVVMQGGNIGAAPVAAAVAGLAGRPAVARRLLIGGLGTWALSKVVKRGIARPRPEALIAGVRRRGAQQTGLGFVSGHAAVVTSLCAAALPELSPRGRRAAIALAVAVGTSRIYVAAHLPLDVLGGAALGVAVEAGLELLPEPCGGPQAVVG